MHRDRSAAYGAVMGGDSTTVCTFPILPEPPTLARWVLWRGRLAG
jgi:hypothetical protein